MEQNDSFEYTYSAPEQEELRRAKYLPRDKTETKLERLRRLDAEAERPGAVTAISVGTLGALVFGTGMCCCLVWQQFALGIAVGLLGAAIAAAAYPVYKHITKKKREQIAPEILELTKEMEQ